MDKFTRGTVIHHKVMGRGVIINEADAKSLFEVRMVNGHIERFYAEEMETEAEVDARIQRQMSGTKDKWRDMWES